MVNYAIIGCALLLGALFVGSAILASKLLAFSTPPSVRKVQAYECSVAPVGDARIQFKVDYYLFALLFLVFDIESLLLFPCVRIFRSVLAGQEALIPVSVLPAELAFFVCILLVGLIYAWHKGVLAWEKPA